MSRVYPPACTTPRTRAEIHSSKAPLATVAERYNVTKATARKWRMRQDMQDRSHRPNKLSTTLTPAQEALVVELRRTLLLSLDDLLAITHEFINKEASRSGLDRCLRRHGANDLKSLIPVVDDEPVAKKTFKDYEPGFLHVDIKHLPQMPDETHRRYLFVAIDRATRWVYFRIYGDQTEASSTDFLRRLKRAAPMVIQKVLTDNGSQFTDRFTSADKQASGKHAFDLVCAEFGIQHRLCRPRHPQTNGMVECFNGCISEIVAQTRFSSAAELESTLTLYLKTYNHSIPQRVLKHQTPIQSLKAWREKSPSFSSNISANTRDLTTRASHQSGSPCVMTRPKFYGKPFMFLKSVFLLSLLVVASASLSVAAEAQSASGTKAPRRAISRAQLKSEAKSLALATEVTESINEQQMDIATRVHTGLARCEFQQQVHVQTVEGQPGQFQVNYKNAVYRMVPEATTSGAVRLQDKKAGVIWIQIPTKSMLMNSKAGQRLVDNCMHSEQQLAAEAPNREQ